MFVYTRTHLRTRRNLASGDTKNQFQYSFTDGEVSNETRPLFAINGKAPLALSLNSWSSYTPPVRIINHTPPHLANRLSMFLQSPQISGW